MTQKYPLAPENTGEIIIYQTADGQTSIDVKMENETVWLTQAQMSMLFQKDRTVIGRHIRNIFKEGELDENATCAKFAHMGIDEDQVYQTTFYNLDVIISVGYRVKSQRGTQFRIWANRVLKEYLIKGYAINNRLAAQKYEELKQLVQILGRTVETQETLSQTDTQEMKTNLRRGTRRPHSHDCREPHRRERRDGEGCGKLDKPKELKRRQ